MSVVNGKQVFTTFEELVNPKHTALLLIDLQNDYVRPRGSSDRQGKDLSAIQDVSLMPVYHWSGKALNSSPR